MTTSIVTSLGGLVKKKIKAALKAYECSSLLSAKVIGSQLMGKPDIQTAINDLMEMKGIGRNFQELIAEDIGD